MDQQTPTIGALVKVDGPGAHNFHEGWAWPSIQTAEGGRGQWGLYMGPGPRQAGAMVQPLDVGGQPKDFTIHVRFARVQTVAEVQAEAREAHRDALFSYGLAKKSGLYSAANLGEPPVLPAWARQDDGAAERVEG